ncbi:MAG: DUF924 domain-containing protein [Acidobacteria bacterium]|nr:MAG: DUF924 domain-containing protein [Acidobacteriota bacterium]
METIETIVDFWFGQNTDDAALAKEQSSLWWSKNPDTDVEIRRRFESLVIAAKSGDLDDWRLSIEGRLALILLTDQFPRNIFRDSPAAFRCDALARNLCVEGLAARADRELRPIERVFFYLPLEHSEDLGDQNRCLALFRELAHEVSEDLKQTFDNFVEFALRHQIIIERFARFPHRNGILGRQSTPAEIEFLEQPNSSF